MRSELVTIDCAQNYPNSLRQKVFRAVRYVLNYQDPTDRALLDELIEKAESMSLNVCKGKANDSLSDRSRVTVRSNCYAGVISEYFWKALINSGGKTYVKETDFVSASNQIDLEIVSNRKKIEVRSSFPRNGCEFAICNPKYQFDILGPYNNAYKPEEISKDYFLRTFFVMRFPSEILMKVRSSDFIIDLVGGATWDMMWNPAISKYKTLTPEFDYGIEVATSYRVVPMCYALDTVEIVNLIRKECIERN